MKKLLCLAALLLSSTAFAGDKTAAANMKNEEAIKAVFTQFDAIHNRGDVKGMTALFTEDGTFMEPMGEGMLLKGRADIDKHMTAMMADPNMKGSQLKHTVQNVRWLSKDVALADCALEVTGMKAPEGMPANAPMPKWHSTVVLVNKGGKWMISDVRPFAIMPKPMMAPGKGT